MAENQVQLVRLEDIKNVKKSVCDAYMESLKKKYGHKDYVYWNGLEKGFDLAVQELNKIFNLNIG